MPLKGRAGLAGAAAKPVQGVDRVAEQDMPAD
jgi:hypothetical protein